MEETAAVRPRDMQVVAWRFLSLGLARGAAPDGAGVRATARRHPGRCRHPFLAVAWATPTDENSYLVLELVPARLCFFQFCF